LVLLTIAQRFNAGLTAIPTKQSPVRDESSAFCPSGRSGASFASPPSRYNERMRIHVSARRPGQIRHHERGSLAWAAQ
jgi:hypothetical protein